MSELAAIIESSKSCKPSRSKVEISVIENLLKLVATKSTRVREIVTERLTGNVSRLCRKQSTMRVRILGKFHSVRLSKLLLVWKNISSSEVGTSSNEPSGSVAINPYTGES